MIYTLVHYPKIDTSKIEVFREKYDPYFGKMNAHITIVFPVPASISEPAVAKHVENVLKNWEPFPIHLKGLVKAWDHWLFLTLKEGNDEIIKLHDEMYTGILRPYLREDIEFIPHIAIGLFVKEDSRYSVFDPQKAPLDKSKYKKALREAKSLNFDYHSAFGEVTLKKIDETAPKILEQKVFKIGKTRGDL